MAGINVGGQYINLTNVRPSGRSIQISGHGQTYYGRLSTRKPNHRTLNVRSGNQNYYLVNATTKINWKISEYDLKGKNGGSANIYYFKIFDSTGKCVLHKTNLTLNGQWNHHEGSFVTENLDFARIELHWCRDCKSDGTVQAWFYLWEDGGPVQTVASCDVTRASFKAWRDRRESIYLGSNTWWYTSRKYQPLY